MSYVRLDLRLETVPKEYFWRVVAQSHRCAITYWTAVLQRTCICVCVYIYCYQDLCILYIAHTSRGSIWTLSLCVYQNLHIVPIVLVPYNWTSPSSHCGCFWICVSSDLREIKTRVTVDTRGFHACTSVSAYREMMKMQGNASSSSLFSAHLLLSLF